MPVCIATRCPRMARNSVRTSTKPASMLPRRSRTALSTSKMSSFETSAMRASFTPGAGLPPGGGIALRRLRCWFFAPTSRLARLLGLIVGDRRPAVCMRALPRPAVRLGIERRIGERRQAADRRRQLAIDLRPRFWRAAGRKLIEDAVEALGRKVLVKIIIDLRHRRVHASAEAFDLDPRELAVVGDVELVANALVTDLRQRLGAAQHAGRGAAELHVEASDRR